MMSPIGEQRTLRGGGQEEEEGRQAPGGSGFQPGKCLADGSVDSIILKKFLNMHFSLILQLTKSTSPSFSRMFLNVGLPDSH